MWELPFEAFEFEEEVGRRRRSAGDARRAPARPPSRGRGVRVRPRLPWAFRSPVPLPWPWPAPTPGAGAEPPACTCPACPDPSHGREPADDAPGAADADLGPAEEFPFP